MVFVYFDFDNFWQAYCDLSKFPITSVFLIKSKAGNQLKFQQHSALAQRVRTALKMLRHEMPDFIIAPNL